MFKWIKWPFVSRKKYDETFNRLTESFALTSELVMKNEMLRLEIIRLQPKRDSKGRFLKGIV